MEHTNRLRRGIRKEEGPVQVIDDVELAADFHFTFLEQKDAFLFSSILTRSDLISILLAVQQRTCSF